MPSVVRASHTANPIGESTDDRSGHGPFKALYRASAIALFALLGGLAAATTFYRCVTLSDPIDVVGLPLLTGYSEMSEALSTYVFVAGVLVFGVVFGRLSARIPERVLQTTGAVGLLLPFCLPAWSTSPWSLPPATVIGFLAFIAGAEWVKRRERSRTLANYTAVIGLILWSAGFPELPMTLVSHRSFAAALLIGLLAIRWIHGRIPSLWYQPFSSWVGLATSVLVASGTLAANRPEMLLGLAGAAAFLLGTAARRVDRSTSLFSVPQYLVCAAVLVTVLYVDRRWSWLDAVRPSLAVAGGAAGAAVFANFFSPWPLRRLWALRSRVRTDIAIPWLAVAATALVGLSNPWLGLATAAVLTGLLLVRPGRKWNTLVAAILTGVLLLLFLPPAGPEILDSFHDGSVLSAVWEFETGRRLFSELFPLRGYEFCVAWLSRRVLEPTLANYFFASGLLAYLAVGGACAATFSWTRCYWWSFATGLIVAVCPHTAGVSGRTGVPLWLAAVGISALRSPRWYRLLGLSVAGSISAFLGHDIFVSFVVSIVLAILVSGPPGQHGHLAWPSLTRHVASALFFLAIAVLPFALLLMTWQGWDSLVAYFALLLENARHYAAHCGLPLPWHVTAHRELMVFGLSLLGIWAGFGAAVAHWTGWRTAAWVFLMVQFILIAYRGVARSHIHHLAAAVYPGIVLSSIGIFEGVRFLHRLGLRYACLNLRMIALAAIAAACWLTPHGKVTPWGFARYARGYLSRSHPELVRSPVVMERVAADEYVWEMESAMLSFVHERHNSSRHPLTFCIPSPDEQRRVVEEFRQRPPKLIAWQFSCGTDWIPNPLRFYVISQYVYAHYRPAAPSYNDAPLSLWQLFSAEEGRAVFGWSFLEPVPPDWHGQQYLPPAFVCPLPLKELPIRWGESRVERMTARIVARRAAGSWAVPTAHTVPDESQNSQPSTSWEVACTVSPREFNYLALELACQAAGNPTYPRRGAVLEFAPHDLDYEQESQITFSVVADGATRLYLVPIGCSPGWSWRHVIDKIRLTFPDGVTSSRPSLEFWKVDELSTDL